MPPIGVDSHGEFLAATGRTARVRQDNGVTVGGEELRVEAEFAGVLRLRSAVRPEQGRRFCFHRGRVERAHGEAMDLRAVRALEFRLLDARAPQIFQERFRLFREIAEIAFLHRENFVGAIGRADAHDDLPVATHIVGGYLPSTGRDRLRRAAIDRDAEEMLSAIVLNHRED